jgi:hypothetical protein
MRAVTTWLLIAVAAATALVGVASAGAGSERPRPLYVSARGDTVRATLGSYCIADDVGASVCSDSAYPLAVRGRLDVSPPRLVVFRTHDTQIKRLSARLLRVDGQDIEDVGRIDVHRAYSHGARWRAEMPRRLHGANRIDVFVRYMDGIGDADFWVKIAER